MMRSSLRSPAARRTYAGTYIAAEQETDAAGAAAAQGASLSAFSIADFIFAAGTAPDT